MFRLTIAALVSAVITGCGAQSEGPASSQPPASVAPTSASPTPTQSATPTPTPSPSASPTPSQPALTRPSTVVDAGTILDGKPTKASGTGPAVVTVAKQGEFNVVATIDCPQCTGEVVLTGPGRGDAFAAGTGPYRAQVMTDVFKNDTAKPELWVQADGTWTLDLRGWNDLDPSTGVVQGKGPTVLLLADKTSGIDVDCAPVAGETCMIRAFSAVKTTDAGGSASVVLGSDTTETHAVDLPMPGIVTIRTNGTWKVTPRG